MSRKKRTLARKNTAEGTLNAVIESMNAEAIGVAGGARAASAARHPAPRAGMVMVEPGYPDEWRVRLHNVKVRRHRLLDEERRLVGQALAAGATWSEVARALGVSRQSAHQRFRDLQPSVQTGQEIAGR